MWELAGPFNIILHYKSVWFNLIKTTKLELRPIQRRLTRSSSAVKKEYERMLKATKPMNDFERNLERKSRKMLFIVFKKKRIGPG